MAFGGASPAAAGTSPHRTSTDFSVSVRVERSCAVPDPDSRALGLTPSSAVAPCAPVRVVCSNDLPSYGRKTATQPPVNASVRKRRSTRDGAPVLSIQF